jgi:hypothetical protein
MTDSRVEDDGSAPEPAKREYVKPRLTIVPMQEALGMPSTTGPGDGSFNYS